MAERMKLVSLFSTENGADKQYTVWIEPHGAGFVVQAQWGPRGGTVQSGAKTGPTPVSMEKAEAVYDKTVKEKLAKGYHPGEDAPAFSQVDGAKDSGLRPMLLTDATEVGEEPYILSDDWGGQEKMNGKRIMLRVIMGEANGINRRGLECPIPRSISDIFKDAESEFIFDGELVGETYSAFDILQENVLLEDSEIMEEESLESMALGERALRLAKAAIPYLSKHFRYVPLVRGADAKRALVEKLRAGRREGVVFKNIHAHYEPGRVERLSLSSAVKVKFYSEATLKILHWNDKSSLAIAALGSDGLTAPCGNVTVPAKYVAEIKAAMESPTGYRDTFIRVRYLYATANRILYQPNLDPDSTGRVICDDVVEADPLVSLKLEGKGEEE